MKTKITFYALLALFGLGLNLTSCDSATEKTGDTTSGQTATSGEKAPPAPSADLSNEKKAAILNAYLLVKDALVSTDGEQAATAAQGLVTAIGTVEGELVKKILFDAEHIAETGEVSHQRDHFGSLSENVYELVKGAGLGTKLYKQHCPMAFEGKGANWISSEAEIMNPYFGDKMLHCGKVTEEI